MNKKSLPNDFTSFPTKCTLCPLFTLCPDPLILCPDPPILCPAFYVRMASCSSVDLGQFKRKVTQWFRWKEIDVLFTIAVTLLPRKTQPMADIYLRRQSRTGGGTIYCTRPVQVPDTRAARGQHGPAARQSRVRFPGTDQFRAETKSTSLKLCLEADCTICSA